MKSPDFPPQSFPDLRNHDSSRICTSPARAKSQAFQSRS